MPPRGGVFVSDVTRFPLGYGIKTVQTPMGYSTAQMTLDVYGHLLPGDTDAVTGALAAKVFGAEDYVVRKSTGHSI